VSYKIREKISQAEEEKLAEYPELVRHLLFHRGVISRELADKFLHPDYSRDTHDPFLMKGMERAVLRILSAIADNERIAIFSDYDADGIPGAVILHDFFKKIGFTNFENYIPHRHDEGFGLNSTALDELSQRKANVLITIDCGVADRKEIAHAQKLGIDVIITDHHLPPAEGVPPAYAILDPKQLDCPYPDKNLCGSGVAFKLIQALLLRASTLNPVPFTLPAVGWEKWLLDMVGLATLSDMVPLVGENRAFARYGLLVLRKSPRPGLQRLLRKIGVNQRTLTEDDIVFSITPKLNAASRMGSAQSAFNLLSTDSETEAATAVEELLRLNNERKGVVGSMLREMKKIVADRYQEEPRLIVLGNPLWRPSLLGLAANTLVKEHACPVFLWGRDGEDRIKGSCRSDGSADMFELMKTAGDVFIEYGGHAASGGFSVTPEKIHFLEEVLLGAYTQLNSVPVATRSNNLIIDREISVDEVTLPVYRLLEQLSPFGMGNAKPVFLLRNVPVQSARLFGKEKNHLEVSFARANGGVLKAIKFFAEEGESPKAGDKKDAVVSVELSSFAGRSELRLRLIDLV